MRFVQVGRKKLVLCDFTWMQPLLRKCKSWMNQNAFELNLSEGSWVSVYGVVWCERARDNAEESWFNQAEAWIPLRYKTINVSFGYLVILWGRKRIPLHTVIIHMLRKGISGRVKENRHICLCRSLVLFCGERAPQKGSTNTCVQRVGEARSSSVLISLRMSIGYISYPKTVVALALKTSPHAFVTRFFLDRHWAVRNVNLSSKRECRL